MVDDRDVVIGNTAQMERVGVDPAPLEDAAEARRADGAGVMLVAVDGQLAGLLAVADPIRESARGAIDALRSDGLRIVMLTGDNATTANAVRSEEQTSELQSLMRISYAVFCLKKKSKTH